MKDVMEDLYQSFLRHVFDHPESGEAWFWDSDAPEFEVPPATLAVLIAMVFERSGTDLLRFSDRQVGDGLDYILNEACNDYGYTIRTGRFALDAKLNVIRSMWPLYEQCLARRCPPVLAHLDEPGASPVSHICYMLWDVTALAYWPEDGAAEAYAEIVLLLERVLGLDNDACIESALHGLGHIRSHAPVAVEAAVDRFLADRADLRPELLAYARAARSGSVL